MNNLDSETLEISKDLMVLEIWIIWVDLEILKEKEGKILHDYYIIIFCFIFIYQ